MTIKEIAGLAGVSASTVSKIINNKDDNINAETRSRVLKIVKDYNYTPYASALQASTTKTFLVGVLLRDTSKALMLTQGIMDTAQENGYRIVLCNSANSLEEEHKNIVALKKSRVDGIIWEPVSAQSLSLQYYFADAGIPVQFMKYDPADSTCNIDFIKLGYEATQVLIDQSHTKIACLSRKDSFRSAMVVEGFKRCLFDNRISFLDEMVLKHESADFFSGIHANQFTGAVSSHFALSLRFCEEFDRLQYRIPTDFSLISLRDDARDDRSYPKISCIKIPYYDFGRYLADCIISLSEHRDQKLSHFETSCCLENRHSIDIPFSSRKPKIIVIGSINIDVTLNVDDLPQSGQTVGTSSSTITAGGKGINQSIGVAKLLHPVSLIGRVGNDYEASIIYDSLTEHHVDFNGIKRDISSETGKAYIHVQSDGESTISILPGANRLLSPNDIKSRSRFFRNTSFCLLQTEIPIETVTEAAQLAKSHGVSTILKPATLKAIPAELIREIDYFVPNLKEARQLCPQSLSVREMADYFITLGAKTAIITLGHDGCYVKNSTCEFSVPAISFTPIDTTGAADAFISTFAVYLACGYSLERAVRIATYAASFCINRQGVVSALIDRNSLEVYIKQKEPGLL